MGGHWSAAPARLQTGLTAVSESMRTRKRTCPERQMQRRMSASGAHAKTIFSPGNYILSVSEVFLWSILFLQSQEYCLCGEIIDLWVGLEYVAF